MGTGWEVLCKSHTAYMTRYTARVGHEPKGRAPYGSLDEARGALGSDLQWENVHFREVGGVLAWQTRAAVHLSSLNHNAQPLKGQIWLEAHRGCCLRDVFVDLLHDRTNPSEIFSGPHGRIMSTQGRQPLPCPGFSCQKLRQYPSQRRLSNDLLEFGDLGKPLGVRLASPSPPRSASPSIRTTGFVFIPQHAPAGPYSAIGALKLPLGWLRGHATGSRGCVEQGTGYPAGFQLQWGH